MEIDLIGALAMMFGAFFFGVISVFNLIDSYRFRKYLEDKIKDKK